MEEKGLRRVLVGGAGLCSSGRGRPEDKRLPENEARDRCSELLESALEETLSRLKRDLRRLLVELACGRWDSSLFVAETLESSRKKPA